MWQLLPADVAGVELSPVVPFGTCSAVAPVSQNRIVTTMRASEVLSDPTNALAVEAAARRRRRSEVHLAAAHRVLRAQDFGGDASAHFRLFALVSSARDTGSGDTQARLLVRHLTYWRTVLAELAPAAAPRLHVTTFDDRGRPGAAGRHRPTGARRRCGAARGRTGAVSRSRVLHGVRTADHRSGRQPGDRRRRPHRLDRPAERRREGTLPRLLPRHRTSRRRHQPLSPAVAATARSPTVRAATHLPPPEAADARPCRPNPELSYTCSILGPCWRGWRRRRRRSRLPRRAGVGSSGARPRRGTRRRAPARATPGRGQAGPRAGAGRSRHRDRAGRVLDGGLAAGPAAPRGLRRPPAGRSRRRARRRQRRRAGRAGRAGRSAWSRPGSSPTRSAPSTPPPAPRPPRRRSASWSSGPGSSSRPCCASWAPASSTTSPRRSPKPPPRRRWRPRPAAPPEIAMSPLSELSDGRLRLSGTLDAEAAGLLRAAIDPMTAPSGPGRSAFSPGNAGTTPSPTSAGSPCAPASCPSTAATPPSSSSPPASRRWPGSSAPALSTPACGSPRRRSAGSPATPRSCPPSSAAPARRSTSGRQRRLVTGPLRRALVLRDRGCAFPGCDRPPRWCDAHHIHHWADGGSTSLTNAVLLCGHHHRHVHQWRVDRPARRRRSPRIRPAGLARPRPAPPPQPVPPANVTHHDPTPANRPRRRTGPARAPNRRRRARPEPGSNLRRAPPDGLERASSDGSDRRCDGRAGGRPSALRSRCGHHGGGSRPWRSLSPLPPPGRLRTLSLATLANTIGTGLWVTGAALFLTRAVGLTPTEVGLGLTLAGLVGLTASVPLGGLADRRDPEPPRRPATGAGRRRRRVPAGRLFPGLLLWPHWTPC